jgi:hypothetical protein
VLEYLY